MALPQGVNFRSTAGYVTDGTNYDYSIEGASRAIYPWTTAQGNNVGWEVVGEDALQSRDRNSSNDARIAGIHFFNDALTEDFRIDLPSSGNYNIGLGAGDPSYACPVPIDLYDTSSSLGSLTTGSTSASQRFKDATNTEYTNVTWPTSQALVSKTFSTTICRFRLIGDASVSRICSVYVEAGAVDPGFTYRATITVTSNSALLPSTQTNYPLWVDITHNALKTVANGGAVTSSFFAYDVVPFSDSALTSMLDFEMEIDTDNGYEGASSGRWRGWVKIPSLALGTVFYLGIGNASITTQQGTPANTWDADFQAVYHLAAKPTVGHGADSTVNANHGTTTGTTDNDTAKLLGGLNFDGSTAEVAVADDTTLQLGTGDLTVSAWVNSSDTTKGATQQNTIVSKDFLGIELLIYEGTLAAYIGGAANICQGDDILSDNTWYYVAVTRSGSSVKTLINGVVDGTATNSADADNVGVDVYFGRRGSTGSADQRLVGILDEVRISDVARSDDWLETDYNSQNDPGTFISFSVASLANIVPQLRGATATNLRWR